LACSHAVSNMNPGQQQVIEKSLNDSF